MSNLPERLSEAQAFAALFEIARSSIREQSNVTGYAAYAAALDEDDHAVAVATRARRNERARQRAERGKD